MICKPCAKAADENIHSLHLDCEDCDCQHKRSGAWKGEKE